MVSAQNNMISEVAGLGSVDNFERKIHYQYVQTWLFTSVNDMQSLGSDTESLEHLESISGNLLPKAYSPPSGRTGENKM